MTPQLLSAALPLAAGLVAAALAYIVAGRRRSSGARLGWSASAFLGVALLVALGSIVLRQPDPMTGVAGPQGRLLEAIASAHPEARPEIDAIGAESDPQAARLRATDVAQRYFPRHLPTASDGAVLRFASEMTALFETLMVRDANACKGLASGHNFGDALDPQGLAPALDAMAEVIETSVRSPQSPPAPERAQELLGVVVQKVYDGPGADQLLTPQMLMQPAQADAGRLCRTMIAFYRTILALPAADASIVLRVLMGGGVKRP